MIKIYQHTQRGIYHQDHNEDFLVSTEITKHIHAIAVMDGCSAGRESHFASALKGKILRKIFHEIAYRAFVEKRELMIDHLLDEATELLFLELREIKNKLMLDKYELLSTLILGITNIKNKTARILIVGDGLVCCNGELFEYDQNNKPDYMGYHLDMKFEDWYEQQDQRLSLKEVKDISIVTDGIFSFQKQEKERIENADMPNPIEYLLKNLDYSDKDYMLRKKVVELGKNHGLKPMDDIAITRLIMD